jgi:hypothetical protein
VSDYFYVFELGSASTWGKYIVPAASYVLNTNDKGRLRLASVVPSSVDMVDIKNLEVVHRDNLVDAVQRLIASKEKSR